MLYEDCIEFYIDSWRQELSSECASNSSSIHISLKGMCDGISVLCGVWADEEAPEPSKIFRSAGLFKTKKSASSLNELRASATKALMDVHVSVNLYDRILGILIRNTDNLSVLRFSAYYEIFVDKVTDEYCNFGLHSFEIQEGIPEENG